MTDARPEIPQACGTAYQVAVVGAGPAGLAAGLAFAHLGLKAAVIGPLSDANDGRTAALFQPSVDFLKRIGGWDAIAPAAEPIKAIRLTDATPSILRAPEVTFWAHEIGHDVFGYNVPTGGLAAALEDAASGRLTRIASAGAETIAPGPDGAVITTREGACLSAALVAGADGRNSASRAAAGIETTSWAYPQSALVTTFQHTRPHGGISTELHRRAGPLTVVPMPGHRSSLVWVDTPEEAQRLAASAEAIFAAELSHHLA
ncbi:MAG: FAD-dependent monooxygenase, partial [Beijerinckiaceae bacterium]